ncbi:hypothetical protein ACSBR2_014838 [Camellia fascicularis]
MEVEDLSLTFYEWVIVAMDPGHIDPTMLTLQQSHRSSLAWTISDDVDSVILACRRREATIERMGPPNLDLHLFTALVERWRSETHTFHLTSGEATITLQDVNILFGLRVDGKVITGNTSYDWLVVCNRLTYGNLPIDVDDVIVQRYARAFILQLLGCSIFAGKFGSTMQLMFLRLLEDFDVVGEYSWGSAALAWLY